MMIHIPIAHTITTSHHYESDNCRRETIGALDIILKTIMKTHKTKSSILLSLSLLFSSPQSLIDCSGALIWINHSNRTCVNQNKQTNNALRNVNHNQHPLMSLRNNISWHAMACWPHRNPPMFVPMLVGVTTTNHRKHHNIQTSK